MVRSSRTIMINQSDKDGDIEISVDESYRITKMKFLE